MINTITISGNIGQDPDHKTLPTGTNIVNFSIAHSKTRGKGSDRTKETYWFKCYAFGHTANYIHDWAHKGDKITVQGEIEQSSWTNKEGNQRVETRIKVLEIELPPRSRVEPHSQPDPNGYEPQEPPMDNYDDNSIPF